MIDDGDYPFEAPCIICGGERSMHKRKLLKSPWCGETCYQEQIQRVAARIKSRANALQAPLSDSKGIGDTYLPGTKIRRFWSE